MISTSVHVRTIISHAFANTENISKQFLPNFYQLYNFYNWCLKQDTNMIIKWTDSKVHHCWLKFCSHSLHKQTEVNGSMFMSIRENKVGTSDCHGSKGFQLLRWYEPICVSFYMNKGGSKSQPHIPNHDRSFQ